MSASIRFALNVQVLEREDTLQPFLDVTVHAWSGSDGVTTLKLGSIVDFDWPEHAGRDNVEDFALNAARVVTRHLAAVQMDAVEAGGLHTRHDLAKEAGDVQ